MTKKINTETSDVAGGPGVIGGDSNFQCPPVTIRVSEFGKFNRYETGVRRGSVASSITSVESNSSRISKQQRPSIASVRRKSLAAAVRKVGALPREPIYGDDWNLRFQPAGNVQFLHWTEKDNNEVEITSFCPGLDGNNRAPTYTKKQCKYPIDATPEEAGFVEPPSKLLGQWFATAICGNDITSSIIFAAGHVSQVAGYYTPLCLLLVVLLLYFFRAIYTEVVTALPLNGGAYTAMLNTTQKSFAIVAACLSFLSYAATVVTYAATANSYLVDIWDGVPMIPGTIVVICFFAILTLIGLRTSAVIATVIFVIHLVVLAVWIACSIGYAIQTGGKNILDHYRDHDGPTYPVKAIVLGFSIGMLGVTGFESSANFVQNQKPGVFRKTLRNMWITVALLNPAVGFLSFAVMPYNGFYEKDKTGNYTVRPEVVNALLAEVAEKMSDFVGGHWLRYLVIADAIMVLCGSVLTGFVGVIGLLNRMVDDDIFPRSWAAKLPKTGARYPLILLFTTLCCALALITAGNLDSVTGVFVICFLCEMFVFCLSNLIMKHTRRELKREQRAKWYVVVFCMAALLVALTGNCVSDPIIIGYAALFISVFMTIFYCMSARTFLIRGFLILTERLEEKSRGTLLKRIRAYLVDVLYSIEQLPVVFFSRRLNIRKMNLAVGRILNDELTRRLTFVHFYNSLEEIPENFNFERLLLDTQMFPNLQIDSILIKGRFGPGAVRLTECILDVPPNRMFIGAPSPIFPYTIAELGSVRIILDRDGLDDDADAGSGSDDDPKSDSTDKQGSSDGSHAPSGGGGDHERPTETKVFRNRFLSIAGPDSSYLTSSLTGLAISSSPSLAKKSVVKRQISRLDSASPKLSRAGGDASPDVRVPRKPRPHAAFVEKIDE